jgi:hypothetical protein
LRVAQKVPGPGEEEKVRSYIFERHPKGRSSDDHPGANTPANQLVEKPESDKKDTELSKDKEKVVN